MANSSPNSALLERLKKARARSEPPTDTSTDTFYEGFSAKPVSAIEAPATNSIPDQEIPPANTAERAGEREVASQPPHRPAEKIPKPAAQPKEGAQNRTAPRGRPAKKENGDASQLKTQVKISLTVRPELRERVEAYSQAARTRAQLVLRKVWDQDREAFLTKLADTLDVHPIEGARRNASKGLYYIGGLSVDAGLLERVLQRNDPHGLNGSGKVFKAWCDPLFNEAIDVELKKAGF